MILNFDWENNNSDFTMSYLDEEQINNNTGYNCSQRNGQRIYGGPPEGWQVGVYTLYNLVQIYNVG